MIEWKLLPELITKTHISTRSTLIPQGSVASSRAAWQINKWMKYNVHEVKAIQLAIII